MLFLEKNEEWILIVIRVLLKIFYSFILIVTGLLLKVPEDIWACSVCFYGEESASTLGIKYGLVGLLVILLFLMGFFVKFFIGFNRRARLSTDAGKLMSKSIEDKI